MDSDIELTLSLERHNCGHSFLEWHPLRFTRMTCWWKVEDSLVCIYSIHILFVPKFPKIIFEIFLFQPLLQTRTPDCTNTELLTENSNGSANQTLFTPSFSRNANGALHITSPRAKVNKKGTCVPLKTPRLIWFHNLYYYIYIYHRTLITIFVLLSILLHL